MAPKTSQRAAVLLLATLALSCLCRGIEARKLLTGEDAPAAAAAAPATPAAAAPPADNKPAPESSAHPAPHHEAHHPAHHQTKAPTTSSSSGGFLSHLLGALSHSASPKQQHMPRQLREGGGEGGRGGRSAEGGRRAEGGPRAHPAGHDDRDGPMGALGYRYGLGYGYGAQYGYGAWGPSSYGNLYGGGAYRLPATATPGYYSMVAGQPREPLDVEHYEAQRQFKH